MDLQQFFTTKLLLMPTRTNTNPHIVSFQLDRNGNFPNSALPVLVYQGAFELPKQKNKAAEIIQAVFNRNGWRNSWRNGIYDFHHYHSITHECLAVSMGSATVILGGPNGKRIKIKAGDVLILPAGVAHKCSSYSKDFLCVGAYPQGKDYDTNRGTADELERALKNIEKLSLPAKDPVFGTQGFLKTYWK
jgi:uncharacterized protein YjlB